MLDRLGELFCDHNLFKVLKAGTKLYRVRLHAPGDAPPNTLADLGPPPEEAARFSNRMSPAGVSMLYCAFDEATALAETYVRHDGMPAEATIATFELAEDVTVLDLAELPSVPSVFDGEWVDPDRPTLLFLHAFVADLTQPIAKDGKEHVEYVPSQVVTEFVRYRLLERRGAPIHGLVYRSARYDQGVGCVLFVSHEELSGSFGSAPAIIKLRVEDTKTVPVDTT